MLVFNASTMILLAKAELLEGFLDSVGPQVAILKEVEKECCGARKSPDALLIQKAISEKKIKVVAIRNQRLCEKIQGDFPLARGEAEAVALAVSEKAGLGAIDDKQGINACKLLRIPFTTAIDTSRKCGSDVGPREPVTAFRLQGSATSSHSSLGGTPAHPGPRLDQVGAVLQSGVFAIPLAPAFCW